ncbi:hypothetical protein P4S68_02985 [Pseudoalteromonas sp. Hal099]
MHNPANLKKWKEKFKTDRFLWVLDEITKRRTSPNGVFGIKLHYQHIEEFGGFEQLVNYFPDAIIMFCYQEEYCLIKLVSLSMQAKLGYGLRAEPCKRKP